MAGNKRKTKRTNSKNYEQRNPNRSASKRIFTASDVEEIITTEFNSRSERETKDLAIDNATKALFILPNTEPLNDNEKARYRNLNQRIQEESILKNDLTITDGPAGTGKTFIACRTAIDMLKRGEIEKIYLTRAIEGVGKSLGALPGGVNDKMKEWVQPLYDELSNNLKTGEQELAILMNKGAISIQTLEHIRGRTLKDSILIIDESQNLTKDEIVALVTRIGENSRCVMLGDSKAQIDIRNSGFKEVIDRIENNPEMAVNMAVTRYTADDINRSRLVRDFMKIMYPSDATSPNMQLEPQSNEKSLKLTM